MNAHKWFNAVSLFAAYCSCGAAELSGTVDWAHRVALSMPVSGVVQEVQGEPGALVAKKTLLYRLDPRRFESAVRAAQAHVDRAIPQNLEASREAERTQELYDRTVLSQHDLEQSQTQLAKADAELRIARTELEKAKLDLEYSAVHAPFDAIVLERNVNPGQTVVSELQAAPLMVLAEAGVYVAVASLTREQLSKVQKENQAEIRLDGATIAATPYRHRMEAAQNADGEPMYLVEFLFRTDDPSGLYTGRKVTVVIP